MYDIYPAQRPLRWHTTVYSAVARTASRYLSVAGAVTFSRHAHTASLAHPAALVICSPAPGGGCVANPLERSVRPESLTAKPRPLLGRAPWLVARFEMMLWGAHISSCGWAPRRARGPPGLPAAFDPRPGVLYRCSTCRQTVFCPAIAPCLLSALHSIT